MNFGKGNGESRLKIDTCAWLFKEDFPMFKHRIQNFISETEWMYIFPFLC